MLIIENTTEFHLENKSAVTLGKFDGIHLGHRRLLSRVLEQKKQGLSAVVFTFDTSAASFFGGETKELSTKEEKREVFSMLGIDVLIEFPLNQDTAPTEPADFVARYLAGQMQTAYLCAGPDISFGKGGAGDYALLAGYAGTYGYQVELIDKVRVDGEEVSSTRVRQAVRAGEMEKVSDMLGAPYRVSGKVVHGRRSGGNSVCLLRTFCRMRESFCHRTGFTIPGQESVKKLTGGFPTWDINLPFRRRKLWDSKLIFMTLPEKSMTGI